MSLVEVKTSGLNKSFHSAINVNRNSVVIADFESGTGTGLLVTERIAYGRDGIEPHRRKCLDHLTMSDPLPHYRQVVTSLARLCAAHKSGRLSPDIDALFPFDPVTG